jgi:hypothetical protein
LVIGASENGDSFHKYAMTPVLSVSNNSKVKITFIPEVSKL